MFLKSHLIYYFDKLCSFSSGRHVMSVRHVSTGEKHLNWMYLLWRSMGQCQILLLQHFKMILLGFSVSSQCLSLCTDPVVPPVKTSTNSQQSAELSRLRQGKMDHNCVPAGCWTTKVGWLHPIQAVQTLYITLVPKLILYSAFHLIPDVCIFS